MVEAFHTVQSSALHSCEVVCVGGVGRSLRWRGDTCFDKEVTVDSAPSGAVQYDAVRCDVE